MLAGAFADAAALRDALIPDARSDGAAIFCKEVTPSGKVVMPRIIRVLNAAPPEAKIMLWSAIRQDETAADWARRLAVMFLEHEARSEAGHRLALASRSMPLNPALWTSRQRLLMAATLLVILGAILPFIAAPTAEAMYANITAALLVLLAAIDSTRRDR